jgi:hypothetical protein
MIDAGMVIGLGVSLFGLGVALHLGIDGWIRLKKFERDHPSPGALPRDDAALALRLERIEQIVDATAIEVERVAEGQRYVTRALAEQTAPRHPEPRHPEPRSPERVITPH